MQEKPDWDSMSEEEKKKARYAMSMALSARDKNGLVDPITWEDDYKRELLYPVCLPRADGLERVMFFAEEFANGQVPPDLGYVPGFQLQPIPIYDLRYWGSICYRDPVYNLTSAEQRIIHEYRKNARTPVKVENKVSRLSENTELGPDIEVANLAHGQMIVKTPDDEAFLANFAVEAVEHRLVHKSAKADDIIDEYEICVTTKDRKKNMVIAPKDIDNIVTVIQRVMPMCSVSTTIKKAQALITNHVRKQLFALPERHYIKVTGFVKIEGEWIFSHDGAEATGSIVFSTGYTIPVDTNMNARGAYRAAMEFLNVSTKLALMLPLLLMAHLSPMFNLFDAAGYVPRFVLFLNGRSGSLKTSTALVIFRLFKEQPASPEANFKDTEVALEIKLGQGHGKEQYDVVYEFAKTHPNGLAIMVLLETGISRSELLGLTWDDFDAENGILHINQGLVSYRDVDEGWVTEADGLKNEYRRRSIPIVEPEPLKRLREKPQRITLLPNRYKPEITEIVDTQFIFHSSQGKPYQPNNWNNRVYLPFMRELEKAHPEIPKLSAHELRHTRSSLWVASVGPYTAAKLLGHSDLKMLLKVYDHTDVDTLRKALEETRKA